MNALLPLVIVAGFLAILALVGGILLYAARRRPEPGLGPLPAGGGEWNVAIVDPSAGLIGASLAASYGRVRVAAGTLTFTPDGATGPAWQVPCRELAVRGSSFFAMDGADLELVGSWGVLRCTVSRERINQITGNDFKTFRERGYARELAAALAAAGARVQA